MNPCVRGGRWRAGDGETHLLQLAHEVRVAEQLEAHHLCVLLEGPAGTVRSARRVRRGKGMGHTLASYRDLSPQEKHGMIADPAFPHRRLRAAQLAVLVRDALLGDRDP